MPQWEGSVFFSRRSTMTILGKATGCLAMAFFAAMAVRPAAAQDLSHSYSGPFWQHLAQVSNVDASCTLTVNGTALKNGAPAVVIQTPVKLNISCTRGTFDGTVELNVPPETPIIPDLSFVPAVLPPTKPSSATW